MTAEAKQAKRAYQKAQRVRAKDGSRSRNTYPLTPEAREAQREYNRKWRQANRDKVQATLERFYLKHTAGTTGTT